MPSRIIGSLRTSSLVIAERFEVRLRLALTLSISVRILSVSVRIVAGRDDFVERGSVSRSALRAIDALDFSKRWSAGKAPAGHRPALLWLRLRRAAQYLRPGVWIPQPVDEVADDRLAFRTGPHRFKGFVVQFVSRD